MPSIVIRQKELSYTDQGKGRVIVLIHGFLGAKEVWKKQVQSLKKGFRIITIDLPGHGESETIGYFHSMELMADSVKNLLAELKIRKVVMVGHSLGGYVSLAFAEKFPDSVLGLILINSTAKGDSLQRMKSRDQLIQLIKKDKEKALGLLVPQFFNSTNRFKHWKIKQYLKCAKIISVRGVIATVEGMKKRKEREIILKFAPFPYVYFIGANDTIIDPEVQKKEALLSEKGMTLLFEHSSHMIFYEEAEKCTAKIKKFATNLRL